MMTITSSFGRNDFRSSLPMCGLRILCIFLCLLACPVEADEGKVLFERAVTLLNEERFAEAIPLLKKVLETYPTHEGVLWNLGIAAAAVEDHDLALTTWTRYTAAFPEDWRGRAKLIQTYQALGRFADRDREREALFAHWRSLPLEEAAKIPKYCREQFAVDGKKIIVWEIFEPKGPFRIYYRFSVLDGAGKEAYYFSLGSYDYTTEMARAMKEVPPDGRAYHLDRYDGAKHETHGIFNEMLPYDTVRTLVVEAMKGSRRPLSSSTTAPESKAQGR